MLTEYERRRWLLAIGKWEQRGQDALENMFTARRQLNHPHCWNRPEFERQLIMWGARSKLAFRMVRLMRERINEQA